MTPWSGDRVFVNSRLRASSGNGFLESSRKINDLLAQASSFGAPTPAGTSSSNCQLRSGLHARTTLFICEKLSCPSKNFARPACSNFPPTKQISAGQNYDNHCCTRKHCGTVAAVRRWTGQRKFHRWKCLTQFKFPKNIHDGRSVRPSTRFYGQKQ